MPPQPTHPEWATEPYSYIIPHGGEWAAMVAMGTNYVIWHVGPREETLRIAKKHGNRLKRMEASRAPVY